LTAEKVAGHIDGRESVPSSKREGLVQLHVPFTGVLLMPHLSSAKKTSVVTSGDGEPLATVRWRSRAVQDQFEVLDARGGTELAYGGPDRFFNGYQIHGPDGSMLLLLGYGLLGPAGSGTVTLPDGRQLTTGRNRSRTMFPIRDEAGRQVAQILAGSRAWGPPQSENFAFELRAPVLSVVQAVGLAQCIRAVRAAQRG
jgi:hypothetical protein